MKHIGIDVSKRTLDLHVLETEVSKTFNNDKKGRKALRNYVRKRGEARVVLESTASYGTALAELLHQEKRAKVYVANPRMTKAFSRSLNMRAKTDRLDAAMLARFARVTDIPEYVPPSEPLKLLRALTTRRSQLVNANAKEKVRLKEAEHTGVAPQLVINDMRAHITYLTGSIDRTEKAIAEHVKAHPDMLEVFELLTAASGIALVTAATIIAEIGHLPKDMTAKQLVAFAGLDPRTFQSGKMDARRRITKRGNKRLRTIMYMAAQNTARRDKNVRAWRQRLLDAGKPPKVANVAVARRLLHAVHAIMKHRTPWDGDRFYSIPEAPSV